MFVAYPAQPTALSQTLESAAEIVRSSGVACLTWSELDIPGRFIADEVLEKIDAADLLVADITRLNFNVCYEVGYALGRSKRVYLVLNSSLQPQTKEISRLGLFDTLGYRTYATSGELSSALKSVRSLEPAKFPESRIDQKAPIYILDVGSKTDASIRTIARIKKSKILFRSFDPSEQSRLSALEAFRDVASSIAVVVQLQSREVTDHETNNLRAAFVAGLATGMEKELLILQELDDPVPIDYRDLVSRYRQPAEIDAYINELAPRVMEGLQNVSSPSNPITVGFLAELDFGASAAENEMSRLPEYYLPTDHYGKAVNGHVRLVVGRKGSGKTAMFFQVRDRIRRDRKRIVLDLKPEGYQLKHFKEMLLHFFGDAVQEHICKAFWEYVLLLELCHKLLEKDRQVHVGNKSLYEAYQRLARLYYEDEYVSEGDFSERMLKLVQRIADDFRGSKSMQGKLERQLSVQEVSQLLYKHDIRQLRDELIGYMQQKSDAWILFDNIDKGWPTRGVQASDIVILRGLLEATRDMERMMQRREIDLHTIIFLRNDVFELLVDETPDRGKESKVSLDWTDQDLLKELLRKRCVSNPGIDSSETFEQIWTRIAVSHIDGEKSAERLIELSLLRPRNLLNLVNYCKSNAVNMGRQRIAVDDIQKAIAQYSADLGNEIGLEIRDVFPDASDILYAFLGCPQVMTLEQIFDRIGQAGICGESSAKLVEILLWFAFLGLVEENRSVLYSYSVFYDMKKLRRLALDYKDMGKQFSVHPAFCSFLEVCPT